MQDLDEADSVLKKGDTVKASLMVQEAQRSFLETDLGKRAYANTQKLGFVDIPFYSTK